MIGNTIYHKGYRDGELFMEKVDYKPTLYVPATEKTECRGLDGVYLEPFQPGTIRDCREFVDRYKQVEGFRVYGNTDYIYPFIGDTYSGEIDYDFSQVKIMYFDIETTCDGGFPQIDNPEEQVIAITSRIGDEIHSFGLGEFDIKESQLYCHKFETEEELLYAFLEYVEKEKPDVFTGWNIKFFDIPYMVSRINHIMPRGSANKLSPWKKIRARTIKKMNKEHTTFDIYGVSTMDYFDLYKTFTYVNQESYRLDHIAFVELGEKKLSYDEFDSLAEFYKKDFQKFMEYNVKDVQLIFQLEEKMKLLELACALAYSAKVNFRDVFGQVRTWDSIIYHYLAEHNIVIPPKKVGNKDSQYAGAYVKEPIVGMHKWVVSLDLNSLYPHLIMQYNISPETKIKQQKDYMITPNGALGEQSEHFKKALKSHTDKNYSVAANGTCYTKKFQGFLPALMGKMYNERKMYKDKMIEAQKLQQEIPKMNMPTLGKHALNEKCKKDIAKYNNFQLVRKIQLNSAYGAIGNEWFRYYDVDMAEAITLSGQLSIRWIADKLNEFLNKTVGTEDYDYVVASDTDSVYLRLGNLVDKVCSNKTEQEVVDFLDKASKDIILPFIKKEYDKLAKIMNAYDNKMLMDRECIADKGIWTAKKRYILNVHDNEGVRYASPKMKIMGIETTRSSTPQVVRDALKESIKMIVNTDEETVRKFIIEFEQKFKSMAPEDIAFPRSVNGLDRYRCPSNIYKKSTPIAVKGALVFNNFIRQHKLKKYSPIQEGDKIKFLYLKTPNYVHERVISFNSSLPKESRLHEFVDFETQFEKSFLDPLTNILNILGWSHKEVASLESLFG
jgi:DNA polymerase elongation subunit (family B)